MKIDLGTENALIPRFIGGPSIVFLSGDDWKRHRKVCRKREYASSFIKKKEIDCQSCISKINASYHFRKTYQENV
jgi:hypothetical protein